MRLKWQRFPPPCGTAGFIFFFDHMTGIFFDHVELLAKKVDFAKRSPGGVWLRRWWEVVGQSEIPQFLGSGLGVPREAAREDGARLPAGISGACTKGCCLVRGSRGSGAHMPVAGNVFAFP